MALTDPTHSSTLPDAVVAEIRSDVATEAFQSGAQEATYKLSGITPELRRNRTYDVKEAANAALDAAGIPRSKPDTGYVIRSKSSLKGATLTVTLYWGKQISPR